MARITVEDCLKKIDNQFDLVMVAAKRARRIANGADALVELEDDKPTVIALREIAEGLINQDILDEMEEPVEDILSSEEAEELLANTPMPGLDNDSRPAMAQPVTEAPADAVVAKPAAEDVDAELLAAVQAAIDENPIATAADTPEAPAEPAPESDAPAEDDPQQS